MWGYGPMMAYGGFGEWQAMGWMMAAIAVFWIAIIGLAVLLIYRMVRPHSRSVPGAGGSALDLLHERYARGEIERDEYLQKKNDLTGRTA